MPCRCIMWILEPACSRSRINVSFRVVQTSPSPQHLVSNRVHSQGRNVKPDCGKFLCCLSPVCANITFKLLKNLLLTVSCSSGVNEPLPAVSCETSRGLRFTSRTDIQALKNPSGTAYGIPSIQNLGCLNNSITPVLNTKWRKVAAFTTKFT